ncbi:MAG: hypothetical protein M3401_03150 [Actinomycetota bacterium]|nr:hypothetical protein [Actinomycetota bacterium]
MHANDVTPELLRRLAGTRAQRGRVLSLYLNLDPHEHDTLRARSSAVGSLLSEAREHVEAYANADHDARAGLRDDLRRVEELLAPDQIHGDGAHGFAIFADGPDDLLEVLRLPRPVASQVVVDQTPHVRSRPSRRRPAGASRWSTAPWCASWWAHPTRWPRWTPSTTTRTVAMIRAAGPRPAGSARWRRT